jgi:hypothetical protein
VPDLPTPDQLYAHLDRAVLRLTTRDPTQFGPIGSRGRALAWNWSFWGRALVFAYAATREMRFLDRFVEAFADILDQRDDRLGLPDAAKGRIVAGWATDLDGIRVNEGTVGGLVALPLCEFALVVRADTDAAPRYGRLAADYMTVAEEVVWEYDEDYRLSDRGGHYVHPVTGNVEPLNHTHALAAAFVHLAVLTNRAQYGTRISQIAQRFLCSVTLEDNGAWSWPYIGQPETSASPPAEKIWKAGTTVEFPAAAIRHGLAFCEHVDALSRTLTLNVLRPDGINEYVTSRRTSLMRERFSGSSLPGAGLALWFLMPDPLGAHRAALLARMDEQPGLFPKGWLGGARSITMAAAWLMRDANRQP